MLVDEKITEQIQGMRATANRVVLAHDGSRNSTLRFLANKMKLVRESLDRMLSEIDAQKAAEVRK